MPSGSMFRFLLAVFLIFAPVGFIMDIWRGGTLSPERLWLSVVYSGLVAIGYAYSFTRSLKVLPLTIIFQFGFQFIPWHEYFPGGPATAAEIQSRLIVDGIGIMAGIILAYIVFINFITHEGIKQIELSKEMELAGEIHRVLVPEINMDNERFEITGRSHPADEVGGDLIDVIDDGDETIVYMIDVSGHGVGPGLLSGMFKASFRSIYEKGRSLLAILNDLNSVLLNHRKKGLFVTFGGLRFVHDGQIEMVSAGHPPIIRIRKNGDTEELKDTQLPLLTLKNYQYKSKTVTAESEDLFIIYSDGIIETLDKNGREFSSEKLLDLLKRSFTLPTNVISGRLYQELNRHGSAHDDQSLIVIRIR